MVNLYLEMTTNPSTNDTYICKRSVLFKTLMNFVVVLLARESVEGPSWS